MNRATRSLKAAVLIATAVVLGGVGGGALGRLATLRTAEATPGPTPTASAVATRSNRPTAFPIPPPTPILRPTTLPEAIASPILAEPTPTPVPPRPFEAGEPITASIQENWVGMTLALDTDRISFGQLIWADVTITNLGVDNIYWGHSGTCAFGADVAALPHVPEELAVGREDWPGDLGILKMISIQPQPPEPRFVPESRLGSETPFACTTDFVTSELSPGAQLRYRAAWDAAASHGIPARPGAYTARAVFRYLGRGFELPRNDLPTPGIAIGVDVPLTVIGQNIDNLAPGEAVDRILADSRFEAAMSRAGRDRWLGSSLAFEHDAWVMRLRLERPSESLVTIVDAVSGEVVSIEFVSGGPTSPDH